MVVASRGSAPTRNRPVTNGAYYAASVLYQAGFRGWPLTVMTAIAGVESNWTPTDLNNDPSTGDYSVGLTQINYFGALLPGRTQQYGSPASLRSDPAAQAAATYNLAGGNSLAGLSNWGGGQWNGQNGSAPIFTESGYGAAFMSHLPQAAAAVGQVGTFGPAPSSSTAQAGAWPGTTSGPIVTSGGYTTAASLTGSATSPTNGCASFVGNNSSLPNNIITIPHTSLGLSMCNWKAIKGGTLLAVGSGICIFGVALVVIAGLGSKSPVVKAVTSAVGSKGSGAAEEVASKPSPAEMKGSPSRPGSASSHSSSKSYTQEPDDSFTEADEKIPPRRERAKAA